MALDFSKNVFELFSGKKRSRLVPTLAIAAVVTAVVAVPLILRAADARTDPSQAEVVLAPADASLVLVDQAFGEPEPLDLATVSGQVLISIFDEDATAVSFNMFAAGADIAAVESVDGDGPQFDLVSEDGSGRPFDTTVLQDGEYELFVTIRTPVEDRRTAVSFAVANS